MTERPAIHPGEVLAEELAALIGLPVDTLLALLAGQQAVTPAIAARLGSWLGTGPDLWLNLQAAYEARVIRLSPKDSAAFAEALLNPGTPNEGMRAAFAEAASDTEEE